MIRQPLIYVRDPSTVGAPPCEVCGSLGHGSLPGPLKGSRCPRKLEVELTKLAAEKGLTLRWEGSEAALEALRQWTAGSGLTEATVTMEVPLPAPKSPKVYPGGKGDPPGGITYRTTLRPGSA